MKISAKQVEAKPNTFIDIETDEPVKATCAGTYVVTVQLTGRDLERLQMQLNEYRDNLTARTVAEFLRDTLRCQLQDDMDGGR